MDEPFVGLDPVNVALLKEAFLAMRDQGKTLLLSTHQMEMVEELCESMVIVDKGRIVVGGPIRDVRRMSGRRVIRMAVAGDGDLDWVAGDGVRLIGRREDYAELEVGPGLDPQAILREAVRRGEEVTRFEIADPTIEEVFIEHVGAAPSDERKLAVAGATMATSVGSAGTGPIPGAPGAPGDPMGGQP